MMLRQFLDKNRNPSGTSANASHVAMVKGVRGTYSFNREKIEKFWSLMKTHDCQENNYGFAEKPQGNSVFIVDVDLSHQTEQNLYSKKDIKTLVSICQKVLKENVIDCSDKMLDCVFLSKDPKFDEKKNKWKHGIHLHFPHIFLQKVELQVITDLVSAEVSESDAFPLFPDKSGLIDKGIHTVPWLVYGFAKENGTPYIVNKIYDFKLQKINLFEAFKNYKLYDDKEKLISMNNEDDIILNLPRILSIIPYNREVYYIKRSKKVIEENVEINEAQEEEEPSCLSEETQEYIKGLMRIISTERAVVHKEWMECGWALYNVFQGEELGLELWNEFSSNGGDKYDENECKTIWDRMIYRPKGLKIGTLCIWAKTDNPTEYKKLTSEYKKTKSKGTWALPSDPEYPSPTVKYIEGFNIKYSKVFKKYKSVFVRANMGAGKTEGLSDCFSDYDRILFLSCKRSLAYDTNNKFDNFELYSDIKGTIDLDIHKKVICQIDSLHRVVGMCDLLIVDEYIDLTNQLLQSKKRGESITAFKDYLMASGKLLVMDANLDRVDFFNDVIDFSKAIFIKDTKQYHTDKTITIKKDIGFIRTEILNSEGRIYVCSDTKKFVDDIYHKYIEEHPDRKAICITSDSDEKSRKEDYGSYQAIFVSPSITAGVSHKGKIDKVYGCYSKRTISAWASTQQMLRCRNWKQADVFFGIGDDEESQAPVNDDDIEKHIEHQWSHNIQNIEGIKIDRIMKTYEKTFSYWLYHEHFKRQKRSARFHRYYFKKIMREHGITIEEDNTLPNEEEKQEFYNLDCELDDASIDRHTKLCIDIQQVEPNEEQLELFSNEKFDELPIEVYEYLKLMKTYGMVKRDTLWIKKLLDKNMKRNFRNNRRCDNPLIQTQLDSETINIGDIKEQETLRRILLCKAILRSAGFTGDHRLPQKPKPLPDDFYDKLKLLVPDIKTVFNITKDSKLDSDKGVMCFVNQKLDYVFGLKLISKRIRDKGQRIRVYEPEFNFPWSINPSDTSEPCIISQPEMPRLLGVPKIL